MKLSIDKPGLQTAVRDFGRAVPHRHLGQPTEGVADPVSAALANRRAGNIWNHPAAEITLAGPSLTYSGPDLRAGLGGADMQAQLNGKPLQMKSGFTVRGGDTLEFGAAAHGCRAYLALSANFEPEDLNRAWKAGDALALNPSSNPNSNAGVIAAVVPPFNIASTLIVRFVEGPHFAHLGPESRAAFLGQAYKVSRDSNRMGLRLSGPKLATETEISLTSRAVFPGTVQLPPNGQPIILGPDGGTTGGYPMIGQVIRADRHMLGQAAPGTKIYFRAITRDEAQHVLKDKTGHMRLSLPGFRF